MAVRNRVELPCTYCGTILSRSPSMVSDHIFCNHGCFSGWKRTQLGPNAGGYRSGSRKNGERIKLHRPDHPHCDSIGYVCRYRLVMENSIGRYLEPSESVHHLDGDESNDDLANLHLYGSEAEHARYHGKVRRGLNGHRHSG